MVYTVFSQCQTGSISIRSVRPYWPIWQVAGCLNCFFNYFPKVVSIHFAKIQFSCNLWVYWLQEEPSGFNLDGLKIGFFLRNGLNPQASFQNSFRKGEGRGPKTLLKKTLAHEEIKSISLQAIEIQSGTAVAGNKIWRIRLCAKRMIFPPVSDRSQSSGIFSSIIVSRFPRS